MPSRVGQYYTLVNLDKREFFQTYASTPNANGSYSLFFTIFYCGSKMWGHLLNKGQKAILAMALTHFSFPALVEGEQVANPLAPLGTWSGDRIVFIGDYSEGVPPFFNSKDEQDLEAFSAVLKAKRADGEQAYPPTLYSFAAETFKAVNVTDFVRVPNVEEKLATQFPDRSRTHHLILNLDKKEYLDPAVCKSPTKMGPATTYVDLFSIEQDGVMQGLFSLLFYSNGCGGGDVDAFRKGRWAGDRLSIRVKETVEDLAEWTDISAEVEESLNAHIRNEK
ncbi:hypothetical protein BGW39_004265 [Mortierella sp. 14UC]|nr:hypothetical protein BGW39_004265 [Mortierella sp. 14UC]